MPPSFKAAGSVIWKSLETPQTLSELVAVVEREYDVERQQAERDVTQFLSEMVAAGLVEVLEGAVASGVEGSSLQEGAGSASAW